MIAKIFLKNSLFRMFLEFQKHREMDLMPHTNTSIENQQLLQADMGALLLWCNHDSIYQFSGKMS